MDEDLDDTGADELSPRSSPRNRGRRWRDMSDRQKRVVVGAVVFHVIATTFTLRDLRRRPEDAVRGPKLLWKTWAMLNTTGSVAYWLLGRRRGELT
ncbi:MAG TPA: hypothetical protein VMF35_13275 [Acidimicrobiales bacterium]|nr:hypothetical protein [Acidimicrobiales bacterium]